jgi:hypothetical protein
MAILLRKHASRVAANFHLTTELFADMAGIEAASGRRSCFDLSAGALVAQERARERPHQPCVLAGVRGSGSRR